MWAFLTLALAAAPASPVTARYAFELDGTPVGTVQLTVGGGKFVYRSTQLFTRGQQTEGVSRSAQLAVDAQGRIAGQARVPESLWLWRRPSPGCVEGRDELTGQEGPLCAFAGATDRAQGTVFGERFDARYGADGQLAELRLGHGRFVRIETGQRLSNPPDLFADGFDIEGAAGPLALSPAPAAAAAPALSTWSAAAARALAREVHDGPVDEARAGGRCLAYAQRFVALARERGQRAAVVLGVLEDQGRAYPHAWVRVGVPGGKGLDLDPSSLAPVSGLTHLALPGQGRDLLELWSGRAKVVRSLQRSWDGGESAR